MVDEATLAEQPEAVIQPVEAPVMQAPQESEPAPVDDVHTDDGVQEPPPPVVEPPAELEQAQEPEHAADAPDQRTVYESYAAERTARADAFGSKIKQSVRDALAAQPHRGTPSFEDLLAVADALADTIAAEMKGG